MTLPSSGPITSTNIKGEFGGSTPNALSEYYRGGGLVPSSVSTSIPTSGTIRYSDFLGTSDEIPPPVGIGEHLLFYEATGSTPASGLGVVYDQTYNFNQLHQNATYEIRWRIAATATYGFTYGGADMYQNGSWKGKLLLPGGYGAGWACGDWYRTQSGTYNIDPPSTNVNSCCTGVHQVSAGHGDSLRLKIFVHTRDSNAYTPNHSYVSGSITRIA